MLEFAQLVEKMKCNVAFRGLRFIKKRPYHTDKSGRGPAKCLLDQRAFGFQSTSLDTRK